MELFICLNLKVLLQLSFNVFDFLRQLSFVLDFLESQEILDGEIEKAAELITCIDFCDFLPEPSNL